MRWAILEHTMSRRPQYAHPPSNAQYVTSINLSAAISTCVGAGVCVQKWPPSASRRARAEVCVQWPPSASRGRRVTKLLAAALHACCSTTLGESPTRCSLMKTAWPMQCPNLCGWACKQSPDVSHLPRQRAVISKLQGHTPSPTPRHTNTPLPRPPHHTHACKHTSEHAHAHMHARMHARPSTYSVRPPVAAGLPPAAARAPCKQTGRCLV